MPKNIIFQKLKAESPLFVPSEQMNLFLKLKQSSAKTNRAPTIESELPLF